MNSDNNTLKARLVQFMDQIPFDSIASQVATQTNKPASEISALLSTYANESLIALDLVANHLEPAERILEIGAGLCLLSLFLKHEGYPVIALEPAMGGYGIFEQTKDAILDHFSTLQLEVLTEPAQQLNAGKHCSFDLIFSNNVIEHIPDWKSALMAMASVLSSEGKMLHSCPNYTIPYEPHYGVPVFRHFRKLSQRMFLPKIADTDIWNSLNFITCHNIKKLCKQKGLSCHFKQGLLYEAFHRIHNDPLFKERHKGLIVHVASLMMESPFRQLIRNIPACLSTPMTFEITLHLKPKAN
jgi:2-polyprenyl-3-methyl-5-hydroxy-6-metoxy-1,4-benzoquinol methylase